MKKGKERREEGRGKERFEGLSNMTNTRKEKKIPA